MNAIEFSTMLREWRARHGYTDPEVAAALGCRYGTLRHWIAGRVVPNHFTLCAVVRQIREGCEPTPRDEVTPSEFAAMLTGWRADHGLTQRQAAVALGVRPETLRGWESLAAMPFEPALGEILRRLRMPVDAERVRQVTKRPPPIEPQKFAELFRAWRRRHRLTRNEAAAALRAVTGLRTTGRTVWVWETARALPKRPLFVLDQLTTALANRPTTTKSEAEIAARKFRRLLRRWRKARGLNQAEACVALGLHGDQALLSHYERGNYTPRPERMSAMLAVIAGKEVQP